MSLPRDINIFLSCDYCNCNSDNEEELESNGERQPLLQNNGVQFRRRRCRMGKQCCSVCSGIIGTICIVFAVIVAVIYDPLVNSFIDKEIIIRNDSHSEMYKNWVEPPIIPHLKVYFFNLTNAEDFMANRAKPIFEEVGPYTYKEKWVKVNISFHENETVSFATKKTFFFDPSLSVGSESDVIRTLNIPATVAVERISKMPLMLQLLISSLLITLNQTVITEKTVNELIWGYEDPLIDIARKYLPKDQQLPFDKFGFFYQRNGSTEGLMNIFTGMKDISKLSMIDNFENSHRLSHWKSPECNMINGTDGTSYPPYVKKTSTLYMFNKNLCRSIPLIFNNTLLHNGLNNYRFVPPEDIFAYVSDKPENLCYCVGGPPCIGGGVFNISACTFNVSTLLSWPHFYQADQKYLDALEGLKPDPLKHSFYIDVNPRLGLPMAAQARFQINFRTMNVSAIKIFSNMTTMIFPVMWFEDGVSKLPPKIVNLVSMATTIPKEVKMALLITLFILGITLVGLFGFFCCMRKRDSKKLTLAAPDRTQSGRKSSGHVNPAVSPENPD